MTFTKLLIALASVATATLLASAPAAQGASCPADQTVLSCSKNDPPYQCAVHEWSGTKSIAALDTKSWTADTAYGY